MVTWTDAVRLALPSKITLPRARFGALGLYPRGTTLPTLLWSAIIIMRVNLVLAITIGIMAHIMNRIPNNTVGQLELEVDKHRIIINPTHNIQNRFIYVFLLLFFVVFLPLLCSWLWSVPYSFSVFFFGDVA